MDKKIDKRNFSCEGEKESSSNKEGGAHVLTEFMRGLKLFENLEEKDEGCITLNKTLFTIFL